MGGGIGGGGAVNGGVVFGGTTVSRSTIIRAVEDTGHLVCPTNCSTCPTLIPKYIISDLWLSSAMTCFSQPSQCCQEFSSPRKCL